MYVFSKIRIYIPIFNPQSLKSIRPTKCCAIVFIGIYVNDRMWGDTVTPYADPRESHKMVTDRV